MDVLAPGCTDRLLPKDQVCPLLAEGLTSLDLVARRLLIIITDSTRVVPMPLMFHQFQQREPHTHLPQKLASIVTNGGTSPWGETFSMIWNGRDRLFFGHGEDFIASSAMAYSPGASPRI